ncbi:serine hydrolase domain-containing protein [Dyella sedimenti]|uniref:serine hydrolase domain-containing protein n=1 Tax=Dyella sedimenti TaxID=2919947 RepID=UPI001FAB0C32
MISFASTSPVRRLAWALAALLSTAANAAPAAASLPDTPAGKLGGELIQHINTDDATHIRAWVAPLLTPAIDAGDRDDFLDGLASAVRDSGGVSLANVQSDPRSNSVILALKGRRAGQVVLVMLVTDPAQPGKLVQAGLLPADDPALYADWPKGPIPRDAMLRLLHGALDTLVRTTDFSGCLTVSDGHQAFFDECRGLAERNFGVPVDHQTRFHIGSMDKMFTAVAIAQLVEAGKFPWDATLAQLVPEYPDHEAAAKITVWQLLHHTSGLGEFLVPEFFEHRERFVHLADYLDLIARQPKLGQPGGPWNYSNAGYVLLGRIIEKASGEDYADYIQHHVFAPAGMDASGFDSPEDVVPGLAVGYYHPGPFATDWKAAWMKIAQGNSAGGGYSTNTDLLRFARALREGKLVKPATLAKMFDGEAPAGPGGYAAGFGDRLSHGRHIRGHAGGIEGTDANLAMVWETGAVVVLTSNEGPSQHWLLSERIADLLAAEGASP